MAKVRPVNRSTRGLLLRLSGVLTGGVLAALLIGGLMLSEALPPAQVKVNTFELPSVPGKHFPKLPKNMTFGLSVPDMNLGYFPNSKPVPIASVTKLMTAYVALQLLGSAPQESKCRVVTSQDVAAYEHEVATGQSRALIQLGEVICIPDLMRGLIVHSASDYALILTHLFGTTTKEFVAKMNKTAKLLGMTKTTYVEPTGIDARDVSTPHDQLVLAAKLFEYPIIRESARLSSIDLPVAGLLKSFTPFVGQFNVTGLKSGLTDIAGGCDIMTRRLSLEGKNRLVLVAIFGARGGDVLTPAGEAGLLESDAISQLISTLRISKNKKVGAISWESQSVPLTFSQPLALHSWTFDSRIKPRVVTKSIRSALPAHSIVAWVYGRDNKLLGTLETTKALRDPSLWQRIFNS
jgi:serine-type D-Ala-D-Ala carboxypeptidase (penicillin-binding protein 5/6)